MKWTLKEAYNLCIFDMFHEVDCFEISLEVCDSCYTFVKKRMPLRKFGTLDFGKKII
ncbi:MAG: hypothetical protein HUJ74_00140 [Lachnospiraceae bacterium]|nr:hypothetical protein [Lachnospiraceae bacterium]